MLSQNVFSAKDVLANSILCDSNTWNSQPYSQANSYSQTSQLSSIELFSQQNGSEQSRLHEYQRSQSQSMEDEPSNYYLKYVSNPPLFQPGSSNTNNKQSISVKDIIEGQKRNVSMKEERDMLQTFINLLKDYTKEVNSAFQNFQDYMEKSFQELTKNVSDEAKSFDGGLKTLRDELMTTIEEIEKVSNEKQDLHKSLLEQKGTIRVLESKVEILEKQLNEARDKESAYIDQKLKFYELEQKYMQNVNNWDLNQATVYGNTPPLSQSSDPLCNLLAPPVHHDGSILDKEHHGNNNLYPHQVPLLPGAGLDLSLWASRNQSVQARDHCNPRIMTSFQIDPTFNSGLYPTTSDVLPSAASCLYSLDSNPHFHNAPYFPSGNSGIAPGSQAGPNELDQDSIGKGYSLSNNTKNYPGSTAPTTSSIIVRRSTKRPKQSPMAMVRPHIRHNKQHDDLDDIFISAGKEGSRADKGNNTTNKALALCGLEQKNALSFETKNTFIKEKCSSGKLEEREIRIAKNASSSKKIRKRVFADTGVTQQNSTEVKSLRWEESVKRKRSLVSMLGISSDDLEVQEISNSIKAQQRNLVKRVKSLS